MANIDQRRKIRALEAKRDALMQKQQTAKTELAATRATLKSVRKNGNGGRR